VSRNLTLTIDEDLIRAARKVALDHNTSVNNLVRGFLESLVKESGEQKVAMEQMEEFFRNKPFSVGRKNWTRADLHTRHT
jgi:hypothetical protein